MKNKLLYAGIFSLLFAASCKETLPPIIYEVKGSDTFLTYTETIEDPQDRRILIEELTGVQCIACPAGAEKLRILSKSKYPDQLSILAFHAGAMNFIKPLEGASKYDFKTEDGQQIWQNVWGTGENKPSTVIDRTREISSQNITANRIYNNGPGTWETAIDASKELHPTTPLNLYLISTFDDAKKQYDIVVKVKYTSAVSYAHALHIFLSQDSIIDAQLLPGNHIIDSNYVFNHVFRKAVTHAVRGKIILPDMATKEAGRVYEYRTFVTIDPNDAIQKYWDPKQMHLTAFVAVADDPEDIHVIQVKDAKLKN